MCSRNHRLLWIFIWALWTQRVMHLIDVVPQQITVTPQAAIEAWVDSRPQMAPAAQVGIQDLKSQFTPWELQNKPPDPNLKDFILLFFCLQVKMFQAKVHPRKPPNFLSKWTYSSGSQPIVTLSPTPTLGILGNVWRHFWLPQPGMEGESWVLLASSEWARGAAKHAQDSPSQQRLSGPECQQCWDWETLP